MAEKVVEFDETMMNLNDIKISDAFANSIPREEKMKVCRDYWAKYHCQDRYLVISKKNKILIDGYVQYLVLKENDVKTANVKLSNDLSAKWRRIHRSKIPEYKTTETVYVYGNYANMDDYANIDDGKERIWRIPGKWTRFANTLKVGDIILCNTFHHDVVPVKVTRIEKLSSCPVNMRVMRVASSKIFNSSDANEVVVNE